MFHRLCKLRPQNSELYQQIDDSNRPNSDAHVLEIRPFLKWDQVLNSKCPTSFFFYGGDETELDFRILHIALKNAWFDLLDYKFPFALAITAMHMGYFQLLQHLITNIKTIDIRKLPSVVFPLSRFSKDFEEKQTRYLQSMEPEYLRILKLLHEKGCPTHSSLLVSAATNGLVQIIQWLIEDQNLPCPSNVMDQAAKNGHLNVIQYLHQLSVITHPHINCTTAAMDMAAEYGFLEVVKFLHVNRTEGCTERAMNRAAQKGQLEMLKWLHVNRSEGCTEKALDYAAEFGHLEVVKWLHENRKEGCTVAAMDCAIMYGHLDVIIWLKQNKNEGWSNEAFRMEWFLFYLLDALPGFVGNAKDLEFLFEEEVMFPTFPGVQLYRQFGRRPFDNLAWSGKLEAIKLAFEYKSLVESSAADIDEEKYPWIKLFRLLHKRGIDHWTSDAMDGAAENGHLDILQFFHDHNITNCSTTAMDRAAERGNLKIVEWLHQNRSEGCTTDAMDKAAAAGQLEMVKWLHTHRKEGCTHLAMDKAAGFGHLEMVQWLYWNRGEGCSDAALLYAREGGFTEVVEWLEKNCKSLVKTVGTSESADS
jgi:ankyrin repeat protein